MNESQQRAWDALGLGPRWRLRERKDAPAEALTQPPVPTPTPMSASAPMHAAASASMAAATVVATPASTAVQMLSWDELRRAVADCRACGLSTTRTQTVFGVGREDARWLLIGEAPGAEEDARGEPFVGQAGRLLDNMLGAIGLSRQRDVFIANVLKCRPPNNRNPQPEEVAHCEPYLARQVELLSPRVIVVMGRFAAQSVLRTEASIASLRGRLHTYQSGGRGVPVVVTYHPAYLLRNLGDKAKAWADLCLARDTFERESGSETDPAR